MASFKLKPESALDLTLEGSVGSFRVGAPDNKNRSLEVKYFLTHVGLDFDAGSNEKVLRHLAPVREIFEMESLDFDEIMQRDIDDARVSGNIIPYLLDSRSKDLVKLFPPIVVVVLPIKEGTNSPADLYPKVTKRKEAPKSADDVAIEGTFVTRSGDIGKEAFEFVQPLMSDIPLKHDLTRLKLNTSKTRLVIVDGQHRAMALLALYRNLMDEWSDAKREPFREYYAEWTPAYIRAFETKEINLPVMLCTFPDLCEGYEGDFNLKKASREIFLTLNKTARKVSDSRNILLDDTDIIPFFLRRCLSKIKQKDALSPASLRIWNIELDQADNRIKIQSPIAVTGVNHIHYMVEHLMLNQPSDVNGIRPRSGKFYKRTDLDAYGLLSRLDGRNLLGSDAANNIQRRLFTTESAEILGQSFDELYGNFIVKMFEIFAPFERHNSAVMKIEAELRTNQDRKLRPIIFEGQGLGRVFEEHRKNLADKLSDNYFPTDVPKIKALKESLDATAGRIEQTILHFKALRATGFLSSLRDGQSVLQDGKVIQPLRSFLNALYENVFLTVAFQSGLIATFFSHIEKIKGDGHPANDEAFSEYLEQLNAFFIPSSVSKLKKLVNLFGGRLDGAISEWRLIADAPESFRAVVYRGEMQPDQWPKYKYLFLEIWNPSNEKLQLSVTAERTRSREQVFQALHEANREKYIKDNMKLEEDFKPQDHQLIFEQTYTSFADFLKLVRGTSDTPSKATLKMSLKNSEEEDSPTLQTDGDNDW